MKRVEALRVIVEQSADLPVVATCAATSRELAHVTDTPNHLYLLDSMGLTVSVATGLAMALNGKMPVLAIDGDGSLLMNLGALATVGYLRPPRLVVLILDNASYASTAGIPTYAERLDLGQIAAACGVLVRRADSLETLAETLQDALKDEEPNVLHVNIEPGNEPNVPLLLTDPAVLADRFQSWLLATREG
jgi:sulfopyruvate decarboxylase subunit beta